MNEIEFAFRIRQALNEGAESVNYKTVLRLEKARQLAVARAGASTIAKPATVRLPALQLATAGGPSVGGGEPGGLWSWLRGAGLLAPLVALVVGFVSIYEWHNRKLIEELADLDFAVLLDDTPIAAYADKGFGTLLNQPLMSTDAVSAEMSTSDALVVEVPDVEATVATPRLDAAAEEAKTE
jgi:hypothetical protein